jgi:hypothetical protein
VAELLDDSSLAFAKEAAKSIRTGWNVGSPLQIDEPLELLEVYKVRLEHLLNRAGSHAGQLAKSLAELVKSLADAKGVQLVQITGTAEHDFQVFLTDEGTRVIGCLRTISALHVSPDRWTELWRDAT